MVDELSDEMTGVSADTGNSMDADAPPPGSGLKTKIMAVPSLSISLPRMLAFNCVEFTKVVLRTCPAKYTVEPGTKFVPFTCNVTGAAVAMVEGGQSEEIMGTGSMVVFGPWETTSCAPILLAESVNTFPGKGVKAPVEAFMEKPRICAKPVFPPEYIVDVEYAKFPVGSTVRERGFMPAANGEPDACVSAPAAGSMEKTEMLPVY